MQLEKCHYEAVRGDDMLCTCTVKQNKEAISYSGGDESHLCIVAHGYQGKKGMNNLYIP